MTLYEYLIKTYGYNEPIFLSEINFKAYSKPWIDKEIGKLCGENSLIRFDKGIYYIPKQTALGLSMLNPGKVIEKKYIKSGEKVFGYYSGQTLLNQLGLSTQMPNITEIYTNNESSKVRDVSIGKKKVRLRRSRIRITEKNAATLCFLELMNLMPSSYIDENGKYIISQYIKDNNIKRTDITEYARIFPDKALRNMIESEVIYSVTQ